MKYHIKPLDVTKTKDFYHHLYGYDLLYPQRLCEHINGMTESLNVS